MSRGMIEFVKAAVRNPREVSTIFPTSRSLANSLLNHADLPSMNSVVELGAGTGAITRHLVPRLSSPANYLGVELDPLLVDFMKKEFAGLRFETGLAENLAKCVPDSSVDVVVSSLPWTILPIDTQKRTIAAIVQARKPGGIFVTYICINAIWYPQARAFKRQLKTSFRVVERSSLEWRNIPPAYVFKSTK
jgi:phosphatidylethanolamine/phosphatidyl-N-methylethanolamine N-methyltransferase